MRSDPDPIRCGPLTVEVRLGGDPAADLAAEREMLADAAAGRPRLRIFSWDRPVVVLGRHQPETDVDAAACAKLGVAVLRRDSGGTAVLHDRDLGVSLALPAAHPWAASIGSLYDAFLVRLQAAAGRLGIRLERWADGGRASAAARSPICFEGRSAETLLWDGKKAVGGAQRRRHAAVLVHAQLLLGLDAALGARLFGVPAERLTAALAPLPCGRAGRDDLIAALVRETTP